MYDWIMYAARYLFVAWLADAHDDPDSPFDAGDHAAGGGQDWMDTIPTVEDDPEWYATPEIRDTWYAALACAGRVYEEFAQYYSAHPNARDDSKGGQTFFWLAVVNAPPDAARDHACATIGCALGYGIDDPEPIGGVPYPEHPRRIGEFLEHELPPVR